MKTSKTIQDADLNKSKWSDCCSQAESFAQEETPQPEVEKFPPDQKNEKPPYYHREIF